MICLGFTGSFAWAGAGAEASGLGRSRMLRTVEAATKTPNPHSVMAMRQRPQSGFWRKTSQISSAISRGVLFTGSFGSFRLPSSPS